MGILSTLVVVIFTLTILLLVLFVLLQDDQGDGIGGLFGGGGGSSSFAPTSGNILIRITTVLGTAFILLALLMAFIFRTPTDDNVISEARKVEEASSSLWWEADVENTEYAGAEALEIPAE